MTFKELWEKVQAVMNSHGEQLVKDGEPGPLTRAALAKFDFVSLVLQPKPVEKPAPVETGGAFSKATLVAKAVTEAKKNLVWAVGSEATKFTNVYKSIFGSGRFAWCGAFVTWCCREAGLNIPLHPAGFKYTFALVETWQQWAQAKGFYHDNDGKFQPEAGDIVLFDWDQKDINEEDHDSEDHIGIFSHMDGKYYMCAEGNTGNMTAMKKRPAVCIQGFVRIPDGYKF